MPQAEALNLLAITLMLGMSPPPSAPSATQAVMAQQRAALVAAPVRDHMVEQDRSRAVIPVQTTNVPLATSSTDTVAPAAAVVIPASH